jgi:Tfp pilus assembly protein PilE
MDPSASRTAEPQFSPDGAWWWDGQQWNAVTAAPAQFAPAGGQAAVEQVPAQVAAPAAEYFPAAVPASRATAVQGKPQPAERDGYAIASLVLGVLCIAGIGSLAAIVLGHLSRSKAVRKGRPKSGLALAGLILGYFGCACILAAIAVPIFLNERHKDQSAEVQAALRAAATAEEEYFTNTGTYTGDQQALALVAAGEGVRVHIVSVSDTSYCIAADKGAVIWWYGSATGLSTQPCA